MKASLVQRRDCHVKCDKSIQFGATERETEAKTKTMTLATANPTEKANEDSAELFPRIEAESKKPNLFLKAELLLLTEHLQRNPTYEKGKGRPLPAQGTR